MRKHWIELNHLKAISLLTGSFLIILFFSISFFGRVFFYLNSLFYFFLFIFLLTLSEYLLVIRSNWAEFKRNWHIYERFFLGLFFFFALTGFCGSVLDYFLNGYITLHLPIRFLAYISMVLLLVLSLKLYAIDD